MGARMREHGWSSMPLRAPETWPKSLPKSDALTGKWNPSPVI